MNTSDVLGPLYGPITAIQRLIEQFNDQGIVIGGVATNLPPPNLAFLNS